MTIKDAVIAAIQITGYSDVAIDKLLVDNDIDGTVTYDKTFKGSVNAMAINVLQGMMSIASVSEGGYSVGYSASGIQARIDALNGIVVGKPTVTGRSVW